jgi:hypothetical protein
MKGTYKEAIEFGFKGGLAVFLLLLGPVITMALLSPEFIDWVTATLCWLEWVTEGCVK